MKRKLLFAMLSIVSVLGLRAQSWTAPTIQGEEPVSGGKYTIYNVGAGKFVNGGKAWFSWSTTAILSDAGLEFTLTGDAASFTLKRADGKFMFTSGNSISGDAMHVDGGSAGNYGFTKLANGSYHIHDANGNESSLCWGYNSSFHASGIVAHADANAEGWNCEWYFIGETSNAVFAARQALYSWYLDATAKGVSADAYKSTYDNNSATADELNAAANSLKNDILAALLPTASNENPVDITKYVLNNADFSAGNIKGWETNYVSGQQAQNIGYQGASYTNGDVTISQFIEAWRWSPAIGNGYLRQTVEGLPEGKYMLECDAIAADQPGGTMPTGAFLYINAAGVDYKTQMATANEKPQHFSCEFLSPGDVDVVFGMKTESTTANWIGADNFTVKFYGIDLSPYATLLAAAVAEAEAVNGTVPAAAYTALAAVVTENNKEWTSSKEYTAAIAAIQEATATAKALQSAYTAYLAAKATVEALDDDATIFEGDATVDVSAAEAAVATATTIEGIGAAVALLQTAALNFVTSVTVNEGKFFDLTNILIVNPTVRQNTNGWTIDGTQVGTDSFGKCAYEECEFYNQNFDFYQTLTLPRGTWEFGVTGFHRGGQGDFTTYFYAGDDDKILIPGVVKDVVNTMAQAQTYFNDGNGKVALKFGLEETSNTIKIGIVNTDTQTDKWTIFRDFTLKFYGSAVDYSVYQAQWDAAVEAAEAAKTAHPTVTEAAELTALNEAIVDEPEESKASYLAKTEALTEATDAFVAAAATYEAWPVAVAAANAAIEANTNVTGDELTALNAAITDAPEATAESYAAKTAALTDATSTFIAAAPSYNVYAEAKAETIAKFGSDLGVTAPSTAAEAAAAPQTFNVAQYNEVATNYPYSLNSKIGEFNTWTQTATSDGAEDTPQTLNSEHWSAATHVYYEQGKNGWAANNFTVNYSKTTTLPAGDYVIKVATRASGNVTGTISATATENTTAIANVGAASKGITTAGVASFDEGTFAKDGVGYGWQWRFLPFTLAEEGEVTITIQAASSSQHGWVSIADGELLSANNIATAVAYAEGDNNTIEDVDLANVTITREIKKGFNTVCLPFDLTEAQVNAAFGAGTMVYAFSENGEEDSEQITINFNKVWSGTISANVPVLVKATEASGEQVFNGVQIVAPENAEDVKVEGTNASFVGVYKPSPIAAGHYYVKGDALWCSVGANINAFRAYVQLVNPNIDGANVRMFIDGVATSINEIDASSVDDGAIYNLAGQRVSKAQKGFYIQNGRKFFVK